MGKAIIAFILTVIATVFGGQTFLTLIFPGLLIGTVIFIGSALYEKIENLQEQVKALKYPADDLKDMIQSAAEAGDLRLVSIRKEPGYKERAVKYIHGKWGDESNYQLYEDSIFGCIGSADPLPHWYLLLDGEDIIGCAGLIEHDFIDRTDLSPWICALYIEESRRGNSLGKLLLCQATKDAAENGFSKVYLCSDLECYYEKYGFEYLEDGLWMNEEPTAIYERSTVW